MTESSTAFDAPRTRSRWFLATVPLAPLALFAYGAFEWLFFVTKPSALSMLPLPERILAIAQVGLPFLPAVFLAQLVASGVSLLAFPRLRGAAVVPASAILAALILILTDNFLYAIFRITSTASESVARIIFIIVLIGAFVVWLRMLTAEMWSKANRRIVGALWIVTLVAAVSGFTASALQSPAGMSARLPSIPPGQRPNVLLLSIDGIDATSLSAYGHGRPTSPFLLSIRDETLFCENAFSNGAQTYTSLMSMLTGRLPFNTKVIVPPAMLRGKEAFQHLPAIARHSGYRTMQLTMSHFADAEDANLQAGFERSNYRWESRLFTESVQQLYDAARPLRLAVIDRLDARLENLIGARGPSRDYAHVIGAGKDPFWSDARRVKSLLQFFDAGDGPWMAHVHLLDSHDGQVRKDPLSRDASMSAYENSIRDADASVERVVDALRKRGQLDRTIIVITSDHGRGWQTIERVPLMIRFPGGRNARREPGNASLVDVVPTILEAVGATRPAWMDGISLLNAGAIPSDRMILAVASSGSSTSNGLFELDLPRSPNHGARSVSAIVGSTWYLLGLDSGTLTSGNVEGHTRPGTPVTDSAVRAAIVRFLADRGFRVGGSSVRMNVEGD